MGQGGGSRSSGGGGGGGVSSMNHDIGYCMANRNPHKSIATCVAEQGVKTAAHQIATERASRNHDNYYDNDYGDWDNSRRWYDYNEQCKRRRDNKR